MQVGIASGDTNKKHVQGLRNVVPEVLDGTDCSVYPTQFRSTSHAG